MTPATHPSDDVRATRLLVIVSDRTRYADQSMGQLGALLQEEDLLVVNDAATLPASLAGTTEHGDPVEARLFDANDDGLCRAVLFGDGDWRAPTEDRPPPPRLAL